MEGEGLAHGGVGHGVVERPAGERRGEGAVCRAVGRRVVVVSPWVFLRKNCMQTHDAAASTFIPKVQEQLYMPPPPHFLHFMSHLCSWSSPGSRACAPSRSPAAPGPCAGSFLWVFACKRKPASHLTHAHTQAQTSGMDRWREAGESMQGTGMEAVRQANQGQKGPADSPGGAPSPTPAPRPTRGSRTPPAPRPPARGTPARWGTARLVFVFV